MTSESGVERASHEEVSTELVPADGLVPDDMIELADGQVVTVANVALYSRDRSTRGRKSPRCRIRVTMPNQNRSSGEMFTAARDDFFIKLVGVRLK